MLLLKDKKMLGKKRPLSFKKLAKKVKVISGGDGAGNKEPVQKKRLLQGVKEDHQSQAKIPAGFLAVYVGDELERFVVPTRFLSHPLFKMLLEKASDEYGFQHQTGLVIPCSVSAFHEVVNAAESRKGKFELGNLVEEIL